MQQKTFLNEQVVAPRGGILPQHLLGLTGIERYKIMWQLYSTNYFVRNKRQLKVDFLLYNKLHLALYNTV